MAGIKIILGNALEVSVKNPLKAFVPKNLSIRIVAEKHSIRVIKHVTE